MESLGSSTQASERPQGVAAVAIAFALLSIACLLCCVLLLAGRVPLSAGAVLLGGGLEQLGPLAFVVEGALSGTLAIGLWRGWRWTRLAAILFAAAGVLLNVPSISSAVVDTRLLAIALGGLQTVLRVVVIYYLSQEPAKEWFTLESRSSKVD